MHRKINVFIGGSTEGLKQATKLKDALEMTGKIQCTVWDEDIFKLNNTFLDSLRKASLTFDFGAFIASSDDCSLIRDKIEITPRDNVILEYGLFLGALGNNRTYLVQDSDCKLPTDLLGYTTSRYTDTNTIEQWERLGSQVSQDMLVQFEKSEIQVLPSTSLAIGYFNSFVSKVSEHIFDENGCRLNKSSVFHEDVVFRIIIPTELSGDISAKSQVYYKKSGFVQDEIGKGRRPFPIRYYKCDKGDGLIIIDMPTALNAIKPSIELLLPDTGLGSNHDRILLEKKELENFFKTLEYLVSQHDYSKEIVSIEWEE